MNENAVEIIRLEEWEAVIEKELSSFYRVGIALVAIRDGRLYRESHTTFDAYCRERWGFSRTRAHELLSAAKVVGNVRNCEQLPATESVARPLTALPKEKQVEAWKEAVETAPEGKVTAKHVQSVVDKIEERKAKRRLPRYKEPKNGWVSGSQAMLHAGSAILQLERISEEDPMRRNAFSRVTDWINNQLTKGGDGRG